MLSHPVVESLRRTLAASRAASGLIEEVGSRIHQLMAKMVDGRVLPAADVDALRASIVDFVHSEALPKIGARNPGDALRLLDKMKAYGMTQLEGERIAFESARAAKSPPPPMVDWPELGELRLAAEQHPDVCTIGTPVQNVHFAKELQDDDLPLPDELLGLYAACDGFDLSCLAATYVPVFSLLPSNSIDISDEQEGYPRRAVVFQGGDSIQFAIYRDRKKQWWMVYEHEYEPIGKIPLDLRGLIRSGIARMNAASLEQLDGDGDCSWERYFKVTLHPPAGDSRSPRS